MTAFNHLSSRRGPSVDKSAVIHDTARPIRSTGKTPGRECLIRLRAPKPTQLYRHSLLYDTVRRHGKMLKRAIKLPQYLRH